MSVPDIAQPLVCFDPPAMPLSAHLWPYCQPQANKILGSLRQRLLRPAAGAVGGSSVARLSARPVEGHVAYTVKVRGTERRGPSSPRHLPHSLREGRTHSTCVPVGAGRPGLIRWRS
eukprot:4338645-Pleurochrysis_carterae.AAC.2